MFIIYVQPHNVNYFMLHSGAFESAKKIPEGQKPLRDRFCKGTAFGIFHNILSKIMEEKIMSEKQRCFDRHSCFFLQDKAHQRQYVPANISQKTPGRSSRSFGIHCKIQTCLPTIIRCTIRPVLRAAFCRRF